MSMKHVIITGGSGFVGSHLCDLFLARGYAVTAVDNYVTGRKENLKDALQNKNFELIEWDVSKPWPIEKFTLIKKLGLHGVLHFACPASPIDFEKIPFEILAVDSAGTFHSVDLALQHNARYLLASTSEIYGDPLVHPQTEDYWGNVNPNGPRACYDETKRFAEALVTSAIRGTGTWNGKPYTALNAGICRIFNTYGPRMRPDDGRVVPELCMQAIRGESLTIHGDGLQTRSFCYVSDLVEGIFKLYESNVKIPVNLGNPVERTVLDFAKAVGEVSGKKITIKHLEGREDDPKKRCPDISRAKEKLKWSPQVDLKEGLKKTYQFFTEII